MKPFKFRVWNVDLKRFEEYDKFYISMESDEIIYQDPHANYVDYINPIFKYEISYSTGLFDKNGNEIFCYDVCKLKLSETFYITGYIDKSRFGYIFKFFHEKYGHENYSMEIMFKKGSGDVEIIGNKYENDDLIKGIDLNE